MLLAVLLIFGIGVSLGTNYDFIRKNSIKGDADSLDLKLEDFVVTNDIIKNISPSNCKIIEPYLSNIAKQSEELATSLQNFESKGLSQGNDYKLLKQRYFLNELQYWMNAEKYKDCDSSLVTILFFYGNNDDSIRQGYALTEFRKTNTGKSFVFNFDINDMQDNAVQLVSKIFAINSTPSMVINSKTVIEGFHDVNSLENITRQTPSTCKDAHCPQ